MLPMAQAKSPFAWPGGKRGLTWTLLQRLPEHRSYIEVFAGSAKLLFAKPPSEREVMNDLNGEVANFFRVAKHRPAELAELFDREILHAARFRELRQAAASEDEVERALRFFYLVSFSYGAKGAHFARASAGLPKRRPRRSIDRIRELLDQAAVRLRNVTIEQRDFAEVLARYDAPDAFFYLDPPYVHFGNVARYDALTEPRRVELFQRIAGLKGKFLMSFDDCDEVRELCGQHRLQVERVEVAYSLTHAAGSRGRRGEVLIWSC